MRFIYQRMAVVLLVLAAGCAARSEPVPGPDKQFSGGLQGALTGAGAGAVTGFQVTAGTGPAAFVGAGFGAIAGGIQGATEDDHEETMIQLGARTRFEKRRAYAQGALERAVQKRMALHPNREIFPADLFFDADSVALSAGGRMIVEELARLNKNRLAWSRLVIATYAKSESQDSTYALYLTKRRAISLGDAFIASGIEPRRIETRPIVLSEPLVIDPEDNPYRYAQAVELIPADR